MYETAPNEKVEPPSDGTLMTKQINNPLTGKPMDEYTYLDVEDEQGQRLYIRNNSSGSEYITVESDTGGNEVFDASSRGAMLNFGNTTCIYEIADITLGDSEGLSAKSCLIVRPNRLWLLLNNSFRQSGLNICVHGKCTSYRIFPRKIPSCGTVGFYRLQSRTGHIE